MLVKLTPMLAYSDAAMDSLKKVNSIPQDNPNHRNWFSAWYRTSWFGIDHLG